MGKVLQNMNDTNSQKLKELLNHPHSDKAIIRRIVQVMSSHDNLSRIVGIPLLAANVDRQMIVDPSNWSVRRMPNYILSVYRQEINGFPVVLHVDTRITGGDNISFSYAVVYTEITTSVGEKIIQPFVFEDFQSAIEKSLRKKLKI